MDPSTTSAAGSAESAESSSQFSGIAEDAVELMTPELFRTMFSQAPVGIGLADEHGHFIAVNRALCLLFGRAPSELLGRTSASHTHPDDLHAHGDAGDLVRTASSGIAQIQKRYVRPNGDVRWAWLRFTHVRGPLDQEWTIGYFLDVTSLIDYDRKLAESEQRLSQVSAVVAALPSAGDTRQAVVEAARDLVDADGAWLLERTADGQEFEITAAVGLSVHAERFQAHQVPAVERAWSTGRVVHLDAAEIADGVKQHRRPNEWPLTALDVVPVCVDGVVVAALLVGSMRELPETGLDPHGLMPLLAGQTAAAVHQAKLWRQLEQAVRTDELSGLPNRRAWTDRLSDLMDRARRQSAQLVIAIADFDRFKRYNDAHGHLVGDDLIRDFARAAERAVAGRDVLLSRWGGEEFTLAYLLGEGEDPTELLQDIRSAVPAGQTCSIGYVIWDRSESGTSALNRADRGLYLAKTAGRDRISDGGPVSPAPER